MKRVILVHGAGIVLGSSRLFSLCKPLKDKGFAVNRFWYGSAFVLTSFVGSIFAAKRLGKIIEENDIIIGHTNGCLVADMAIKHSSTAAGTSLICLAPALDTQHVFDWRWNDITIIRSPGDYIRIAEYIPFNPCGNMMRDGILNRRVENREHQMTIQDITGDSKRYWHSGFLDSELFQLRFSQWLWKKYYDDIISINPQCLQN